MKYLFLIPLFCFAQHQPRVSGIVQSDLLLMIFSVRMDSSVLIKENYHFYTMSSGSVDAGAVPRIILSGRSIGYRDTVFFHTRLLNAGLYRLVVNSVSDLWGNPIDQGKNSIAFYKDDSGLHIIQTDFKSIRNESFYKNKLITSQRE